MSFDDDLDAELAAKTEDPEWATVDVLVNKKLRRFKFTQMDGLDWADMGDRCPPRPTAPLDREFGYNIRLISALAAPKSGEMQDGDGWVKPTDEQWTKLFRSLTGAGIRAIGDVLFYLNQWGPAQAVEEAKKALEVESKLNSDSPDNSESPAADSSDANLESSPDTSTTATDA